VCKDDAYVNLLSRLAEKGNLFGTAPEHSDRRFQFGEIFVVRLSLQI
jgi:hypothetical protein